MQKKLIGQQSCIKVLYPGNKLSEDEKEKDRALVKGIPKILAKAGYTMIKLS